MRSPESTLAKRFRSVYTVTLEHARISQDDGLWPHFFRVVMTE